MLRGSMAILGYPWGHPLLGLTDTHMVPEVVGTMGISSASVGMDQGIWNWGANSRMIIFLEQTRTQEFHSLSNLHPVTSSPRIPLHHSLAQNPLCHRWCFL